MKHIFIIDESERERILGMHKNATKKMYLSEQVGKSPSFDDSRIDALTKGLPTFKYDNQLYNTKTQTPINQKNQPNDKKNNQPTNTQTNQNQNTNYIGQVQKLLGFNQTGTFSQKELGRLQRLVDYTKKGQRLLGTTEDGLFGKNTLEKLQNLVSKSQQSNTTTAGVTNTSTGAATAGDPNNTSTNSKPPNNQQTTTNSNISDPTDLNIKTSPTTPTQPNNQQNTTNTNTNTPANGAGTPAIDTTTTTPPDNQVQNEVKREKPTPVDVKLKKLQKQGYYVSPGTPIDKNKQLEDSGISVVAQTQQAAYYQLSYLLYYTYRIYPYDNKEGIIMYKTLPNKNTEAKWIQYKK